jgi:predicted DNA-binding transcriptional regulator AlpA
MGRRLDVDQLVGAREIADRLHVAGRQTVQFWRDRYDDFPKPVVSRERAVLWYWPDVQEWAKRTGRL